MAAEGAGQSDLRIRKWGKSGCGVYKFMFKKNAYIENFANPA